jgi:hypothetical protein
MHASDSSLYAFSREGFNAAEELPIGHLSDISFIFLVFLFYLTFGTYISFIYVAKRGAVESCHEGVYCVVNVSPARCHMGDIP